MSVPITKGSELITTQKNFTSFKFDSNCSAVIRIKETSSETPILNIKNLNPKFISVVENFNNNEFFIDVVANNKREKTSKEMEVENDLMEGFRDALNQDSIKGFFFTFMKNAFRIHDKHGSIMNDNNNMLVIVDAELPKNFKSLKIRVSNAECNINHSSIENLNIRSSNLDLISEQDLGAKYFNIEVNNGDIDLVVGHRSKDITITGNNCDLKIRNEGYKGNVRVSGNNVSVSGNTGGDTNFGEIKCCLNNGDVNIF